MINIAVCDDDVQFAAALEEKILDYGKQKGVRLDTEVFQTGKVFGRLFSMIVFMTLYTWMLKWEKAMGYIQFGR